MGIIYIAEPGGRPTARAEEEVRGLWMQGSLPPQTQCWREGMPGWQPAAEFFGSARTVVAAPPPMPARPIAPAAAAPRWAKDPTGLTKFLTVMLWVSVATASLAVVLAIISLATGDVSKRNPESLTTLEVAELGIGLVQLAVYITTGVPFLMWIHRANRNARALGAQGMQFTPGWSIGWYFIPIMNLWKPYQAMKEIWQASQYPRSWSGVSVPSLLSNWWGLWLLSNFLGQMSFRLSLHAETAQALINESLVTMASDAADVVLCMVAMRLITSIYRKQAEWARGA